MVDSVLATQEAARNDSLTVGASSTIVSDFRPNLDRKTIVIRNISDDATKIVTINFGVSATANKGIVLRQYESVSDSDETGYKCYQGTITAIGAVANCTLAIMER